MIPVTKEAILGFAILTNDNLTSRLNNSRERPRLSVTASKEVEGNI